MKVAKMQETVGQGTVTHYDDRMQKGSIIGYDGRLYNFRLSEWVSEEKPRRGIAVKFEKKETEAIWVEIKPH